MSMKGASSRFGGLEGRNLVTTFDYAADQRVAKSRMGRRKRTAWAHRETGVGRSGRNIRRLRGTRGADHQAGRFVRLASGP